MKQKKIIESKVLIIGVGGLGSPIAIYLAAARVGIIGIVDNDIVDRTNLQRQVIHFTPDLGKSKVDSAKEKNLLLHFFLIKLKYIPNYRILTR